MAGKKVGSITYSETLAPLPIGNTGVYDLALLKDAVPFDLTSCTVYFTAKYDAEDLDADAAFAYDSGDFFTHIFFILPISQRITRRET